MTSGNGSSRFFRIPVYDLFPGERACYMRGHRPHDEHIRRIIRLNPISQGISQIHQRVPDGGHFPVQDSRDSGGILFVQNTIVQFIVVVNNARPVGVGRHVVQYPCHDIFPVRSIIGSCGAVSRGPAFGLASYVSCRVAEVAQTDFFVVDGMEFDL